MKSEGLVGHSECGVRSESVCNPFRLAVKKWIVACADAFRWDCLDVGTAIGEGDANG